MNKITKWFTKEKKKEEEIEEESKADEELEFETFADTYKIITFCLCIGFMYPNPRTRWFRFFAIWAVLASVSPLALFILIDIYFCMMRKDIAEIIRHSTIVGPFLGGFLKMFFMVWKSDAAYAIITEINRDYSLFNRVEEDYKDVIRKSIRNNVIYSERWWTVTVLTCVMTFPLMAAVLTLHSHLFTMEPQRYMVHELNKPWSGDPETRHDSPYYELINAYMFYCAWFYVLNFLGYDGLYGVSINHACLKIALYCKALEDAMQYPIDQVYQRVVWVIQEQARTFSYINEIQDCFNLWLGIIFLATMIQLCNLLYHVSEGFGLDVRYMIFITGVIIHIYLPCHYAAKLKATALQSATSFYCCGWERVPHQRARKAVLYMVARAQVPQEISALNMIIFDMELFVSILQTSYSMYTLLSS